MDEKARSSSMYGAQPVHSEWRWPITSSSSARASSRVRRGSSAMGESAMGGLLLAAARAGPGSLDRQPSGGHLPMHLLQLRADSRIALRSAVRAVDDSPDACRVWTRVDLLLAATADRVVCRLAVPEVGLPGEQHGHLQIGGVHRSHGLPL